MEIHTLLMAVPYTEPASFFEFCNALRDIDECPEKGDKKAWGELFKFIRQVESDGLVDIDRDSNGHIDTIQLSESGRSLLRQYMEAKGKV